MIWIFFLIFAIPNFVLCSQGLENSIPQPTDSMTISQNNQALLNQTASQLDEIDQKANKVAEDAKELIEIDKRKKANDEKKAKVDNDANQVAGKYLTRLYLPSSQKKGTLDISTTQLILYALTGIVGLGAGWYLKPDPTPIMQCPPIVECGKKVSEVALISIKELSSGNSALLSNCLPLVKMAGNAVIKSLI